MPAISYAPFDGDGVSVDPHRPSLDNLGGNGKVDDQAYPPSSEEPSADEWNRKAELLALLGGVMPVLKVTIGFAGGTPQVDHFWCANSSVSSGDLTLTDNAAGDTTIQWPASKLPPAAFDPDATMNENTNATTISAVLDEPTRTVRVRTIDESAAAGVDTRFTLTVY